MLILKKYEFIVSFCVVLRVNLWHMLMYESYWACSCGKLCVKTWIKCSPLCVFEGGKFWQQKFYIISECWGSVEAKTTRDDRKLSPFCIICEDFSLFYYAIIFYDDFCMLLIIVVCCFTIMLLLDVWIFSIRIFCNYLLNKNLFYKFHLIKLLHKFSVNTCSIKIRVIFQKNTLTFKIKVNSSHHCLTFIIQNCFNTFNKQKFLIHLFSLSSLSRL